MIFLMGVMVDEALDLHRVSELGKGRFLLASVTERI